MVKVSGRITPLVNLLYCSHLLTGGDLSNELVRHFLIECTQKGVRLKGCPNEPYFGEFLHWPVQTSKLAAELTANRGVKKAKNNSVYSTALYCSRLFTTT